MKELDSLVAKSVEEIPTPAIASNISKAEETEPEKMETVSSAEQKESKIAEVAKEADSMKEDILELPEVPQEDIIDVEEPEAEAEPEGEIRTAAKSNDKAKRTANTKGKVALEAS